MLLVRIRSHATKCKCSKTVATIGESLFKDITGSYPKSRGGMKYCVCAVEGKYDEPFHIEFIVNNSWNSTNCQSGGKGFILLVKASFDQLKLKEI